MRGGVRMHSRALFPRLVILLALVLPPLQARAEAPCNGLTGEEKDRCEVAWKKNAQSKARGKDQIAVEDVLPPLSTAASIEAGQVDGRAKINFGKKLGNRSFSATLSTPVSKKTGEGRFANLDGLAADYSAAAAVSGLVFPKLDASSQVTAQQAVCTSYGLKFDPKNPVTSDPCDQKSLEKQVAKTCAYNLTANVQKGAEWKCFQAKRREALERFDLATFQLKSVTTWALGVEVGQQPTEYFDNTGTAVKSDKAPYSLSAGFGWILQDRRLSLGTRYKREFEDAKKAQLCAPLATGTPADEVGFETCKELPLGAPTEKNSFLLSAEARIFLETVAFSPRVTADVENDVLGFQFPVYLLRSAKGAFTGGFKLGWREDVDDIELSVFVSKPLTLND